MVLISLLFACPKNDPKPTATPQGNKPPVAKRVDHVDRYHDMDSPDPYHWLRDKENPEVIAYIEAENAYTQTKSAHLEELRGHLYREMVNRIKETDETVPYRMGGWYYFSKTIAGEEYPLYKRMKDPRSEPQTLLDVNELAAGKDYMRVGNYAVSPDGSKLAYATDDSGDERYDLYVKDLATNEVSGPLASDTYYGLAWADDATLFYVVQDEASRPFRVHRHTLGSEDHPVVFEETDEKFHAWVSRTRSGGFVLIGVDSQITSEVRFVPTKTPDAEPTPIRAREQGVQYSVDHRGDRFYIVTNADDATNFKLVEAKWKSPGEWTDVMPYDPAIYVQGVDAFKQYLVLHRRVDGVPKLFVKDFLTGEDHDVPFEEPSYSVYPDRNKEFDAAFYRYSYSSLVTPESIWDWDMQTREQVLKKQEEVLGGYFPGNYTVERIEATSADGTKVPISLVYANGLNKDGSNPTLLVGYGSYGSTYDPWFSSRVLSLLDRGFVYAIAHVRGGADMGWTWYLDGKLDNKKHTFEDFVACGQHLVDAGYTSPDKLGANGGSAGGLLMGAVANMRPDLFGAIVADVPFVDVINTMWDETIPLTVIEFEEWGNPKERASYDYMRSYSPYDNVAAVEYPDLLITAGLNDPRVQYWEPTKWTAKLRHTATGGEVLLKTNMGAGHGGASGRYGYLEEVAFKYAFLLDKLGADTSVPAE